MVSEDSDKLDAVDWRLLELLQESSDIPLRVLKEEVGLSESALSIRKKYLSEKGFITGYHAHVDERMIGLSISAFVNIDLRRSQHEKFLALAADLSEVRECYHVAGDDNFLLKVVVKSIASLEKLLAQFDEFGQTKTSIIMSAPINKKVYKNPS